MDRLFDLWPWWVAALVVVASLVFGRRLPPQVAAVLAAARPAAVARLLRWRVPKLTLASPPEPADENGPQPSGQPMPTDPDHPGGDTPSGA